MTWLWPVKVIYLWLNLSIKLSRFSFTQANSPLLSLWTSLPLDLLILNQLLILERSLLFLQLVVLTPSHMLSEITYMLIAKNPHATCITSPNFSLNLSLPWPIADHVSMNSIPLQYTYEILIALILIQRCCYHVLSIAAFTITWIWHNRYTHRELSSFKP